MREHWSLDPEITFLTHGTFGAAPRAVLAKQNEIRAQMEAEPVRFFVRELDPLLDAAREGLAQFVGAAPAELAFVPNATTGINAVLRALDLDKHDELLVTNQEYNASRNVLDFVAGVAQAKVVVVEIPFPIASPDVVIERILERVTERTRLLFVDHITSPTALINPIERIVAEMSARGIDTLVDGAHAPGQVPLNLSQLGAAYYTGNLHKWVCAPKGTAFLRVAPNRIWSTRPAIISHGANATRTDRSRYHLEFDWPGTYDPSPWLAIPEALRFIASLVDGGWSEVMRRNHALALRARDLLIDALGIEKPAPDEMIGAMASVPLPDATTTGTLLDPLQDALFFEDKIEVPVMPWPHPPQRLLRISAQLYNTEDEYARLAAALTKRLR